MNVLVQPLFVIDRRLAGTSGLTLARWISFHLEWSEVERNSSGQCPVREHYPMSELCLAPTLSLTPGDLIYLDSLEVTLDTSR